MPTIPTDPNPSANPAVTVRCVNCKGMGVNTTWVWHVSPGSGPGNFGTEVGTWEDYDSKQPEELNVHHPHCPVCGSHAVEVINTIEPAVIPI